MSAADICLIDHLAELEACGVHALKIEGRMKRAEYVAAVTRYYRQALEEIKTGRESDKDRREPLRRVFNRTFTDHYFRDSAAVLHSARPDNQGQLVGQVIRAGQGRVMVKLTQPLSRQDGIALREDGRGHLAQTLLHVLYRGGLPVERAEAGDSVSFSLETDHKLASSLVYKTFDHDMALSLRPLLREQPVPAIGLELTARFKIGQLACLSACDELGRTAEVKSDYPVEAARRQPLTEAVVAEKLGRLGQAGYRLTACALELDEGAMFPFSALNQLRRRLVACLEAQPSVPGRTSIEPSAHSQARTAVWPIRQLSLPDTMETCLSVMTDSLTSARAALAGGADVVYLDLAFVDTEDYAAVATLQEECAGRRGQEMVLALPAVSHPARDDWKAYLPGESGKYMVSNWGDWYWAQRQGAQIWVNASLHVVNDLTRQLLARYPRLRGVCLSPELSWEQMKPMCSGAEIIVHGELLLMISRACLWYNHVGCAASRQTCPAGNCILEDAKGYRFPLATDRYCRQYVYNSRTQCLIGHLDKILPEYPAALRIEGRRCRAEQLQAVTRVYRQAIDAFITGCRPQTAVWQSALVQLAASPLTNGHFLQGGN
jgi:putative protease